MVSDAMVPDWTRDRDFGMEMGVRRGSATAGANGARNTSIEWDLGDFEFPDYRERMNAPI